MRQIFKNQYCIKQCLKIESILSFISVTDLQTQKYLDSTKTKYVLA